MACNREYAKTFLNSSSRSLYPFILSTVFTDIRISEKSGKASLLSLKNSLRSLLILFRPGESATRALTERPNLLFPSAFGWMNTVKLLVWNLFPSLRTVAKSWLLRSLSLLARENFFSAPSCLLDEPSLPSRFTRFYRFMWKCIASE